MFKLNLMTPDNKIVANQELDELTVPGFKGQLNILPGHTPMLTTLEPGIVSYRLKGSDKNEKFAISWGYCQVSPEAVNVLAESAVSADSVDTDGVKKHLQHYENQLSSEVLDDHQWQNLQNEIQRLNAELELVHATR